MMPPQISRASAKTPPVFSPPGKTEQVRVINTVNQAIPIQVIGGTPTPIPTTLTVKLDPAQFSQVIDTMESEAETLATGMRDAAKLIAMTLSWFVFPPPVQIQGGQVRLPPQPSTKE